MNEINIAFQRGNTEIIDNLPIIDGLLLFDIEKSHIYIDVGSLRISLSGGLQAYPIGSIYISVNEASPASIFGGEWKKIEGKFLLGASADYAAGSTGGTVEHILTEKELPYIDGTIATPVVTNHSVHGITGHAYGASCGTVGTDNLPMGISGNPILEGELYGYGFKFGEGLPHNNMPPYLAVHMWTRIA